MTDIGTFAYSDTSIFTNDKAFMMTGESLKFLCAVLNSSAVSWFVSKSGLTTGMGLTQWKKFVVGEIPVVRPDTSTAAAFNHTMEDLLAMIDIENRDAARNLEEAIDSMVFDLYGLTPRETKILERNKN